MKAKLNDRYLMCTVLMAFVLILANFIADYDFLLFGYPIILSVFIYPFTFLFANIITKEYGFKKTLTSIGIAIIIQMAIYLVSNLVVPNSISDKVLLGSLLSFGVSQVINIFLCNMICQTKKFVIMKTFLNYVIVLLFDAMIFNAILDNFFDLGFLLSNIIRSLVALGIVYLEIKVLKIKIKKPKKSA